MEFTEVKEKLKALGCEWVEVNHGIQVNVINPAVARNKVFLSIWPKPQTWMFVGEESHRGFDGLVDELARRFASETKTLDKSATTKTSDNKSSITLTQDQHSLMDATGRFHLFNMIKVTTTAEFIHRYANAPEPVAFLREWHRHLLHITLEIEVMHEDRELEFILVKRALNAILAEKISLIQVEKSCEAVGREIAEQMIPVVGPRYMKIEVSEDGENGSITIIEPESEEKNNGTSDDAPF